MKDLTIGLLNELYGKLITEKQSDIIRSYYDYDLSLAEIASTYGVSRQAAHDAIKKGEQSLLDCEYKLGFLAKNYGLKEELESVLENIENNDLNSAKESIKKLINNL